MNGSVAPEKIWATPMDEELGVGGTYCEASKRPSAPNSDARLYVRADLCEALRADLEQTKEIYLRAWNERDAQRRRAERAEAELEQMKLEFDLLRVAQDGEYADTWKSRAEAAERLADDAASIVRDRDAWREQAQHAASVIAMLRAMIGEMFGPVIESADATLLRGPEPKHDGEAILEALQKIEERLAGARVVTDAMVEAGAKAIVACRFEDESEPVSDYDLELSRAAIEAALAEPAGEAEPSKWSIPGSTYAGATTPPASAIREAAETARACLAGLVSAGHNCPSPDPDQIEKAFWALDSALAGSAE